MRTIAFTNQKGGCGKTTSVLNIGHGLLQAKKGLKVILVDLDPQAHLTDSLGIQLKTDEPSIYEVLQGKVKAGDSIINARPGLDLIPSTIDLSGADLELAGVIGRETLLREALKGIRGYDYLLIDCPPSLNILAVNALTAVREVFIPLQTEYLSLQGTSRLLDTVELIKKLFNPTLEISGVFATLYDSRKKLHNEVLAQIQAYFKKTVFNTCIRNVVALAEAQANGKTIFEYKPKSNGAEDYLNLCREILRRGKHE